MDSIDLSIVNLLRQDARTSHANIGQVVNLAASTVTERIKRLVLTGVIKRWTVDLDATALGQDVLAFIYVFVARQSKAGIFPQQIAHLPQVQECHHITGDWSYLLKVRVASIAELETFMLEHLQAIKGVERTHTQVVLSSADLNR
jgi:Lrp/AsnC family transcriptional regulator, leucine-responsive regulatory protein